MVRQVVMKNVDYLCNTTNPVRVGVLMATYNGEKFVEEQINSIISQENVEVNLLIRDDGSSDKTIEIIKNYTSSHNNIQFISGENVGVQMNFIELLKFCPLCDYYAFSDQDDIWDKDKLIVAVDMLRLKGFSGPQLYCCNVRRINSKGEKINSTEEKIETPQLIGQAIIRSDAQGSTMVFNNQLRELVLSSIPNFKELNVYHDAWIHKLCSAVGGEIVIDCDAHMSYRIHENNVVAKDTSAKKYSMINCIKQIFVVKNEYYSSNIAKELMKRFSNNMSKENLELVELMANYRNNYVLRIKLLFTKRIKDNNLLKNANFKFRVLIGRA